MNLRALAGSNPKNTAFLTTMDKSKPLNTQPHYTDKIFETPQTVFGKPDYAGKGHEGLHYEYSDRLYEFDYTYVS